MAVKDCLVLAIFVRVGGKSCGRKQLSVVPRYCNPSM